MIKEDFYKKLDENTSAFIETLNACSEKDLRFKPEGKWSILEIAEHILISERGINLLLQRNTDDRSDRSEFYGFDKLNRMIGTRSRKVQAPESLQPSGKLKDAEEFETTFTGLRSTLKNNIETGKVLIDDRVFRVC